MINFRLVRVGALVDLQLRHQVEVPVQQLASEAVAIASTAKEVHEMMACDRIHSLYREVHTAVCCDLAYALSAMWSARLVAAWAIAASCVSAVAGYKRFRRHKSLWGPYASVQSREVGSYL